MSALQGTLFPFLYPCLLRPSRSVVSRTPHITRRLRPAQKRSLRTTSTNLSSLAETDAARRETANEPVLPATSSSRLNPAPDDYSRNVFIDQCTVTLHAGSGGNGCVSFQREAYLPGGPPNGGDGGTGGNVWIQAVPGQTSLHKLARRGTIKAGRGVSGQGKGQGGRKGEDICIQVPVGTVIREIWRSDPVAEEEQRFREMTSDEAPSRNKWIVYAGATAREASALQESLPPAQKPRRSTLAVMEPAAPISLDLDSPTPTPVLLVAGAVGGLGNPHFATKNEGKPKIATKGELGVRIKLSLELKLLADVGLVGLPNAGKSTLLRAISNSRTRVGDWAFTTLNPSIGTVVLDNNTGRPLVRSGIQGQPPRSSFTVADIPGLVEDAHLDKGLGLGFLRHVERARILAFVIDLSASDPVIALQNLWREVGEYENVRNAELNEESQSRAVQWSTFTTSPASKPNPPPRDSAGDLMTLFPPPPAFGSPLEPLRISPTSAKPWFVVATKADLPGTEEAYAKLKEYVDAVEKGDLPHPSGKVNGWRYRVAALPVSAIHEEGGTDRISEWVAGVLDGMEVPHHS